MLQANRKFAKPVNPGPWANMSPQKIALGVQQQNCKLALHTTTGTFSFHFNYLQHSPDFKQP